MINPDLILSRDTGIKGHCFYFIFFSCLYVSSMDNFLKINFYAKEAVHYEKNNLDECKLKLENSHQKLDITVLKTR